MRGSAFAACAATLLATAMVTQCGCFTGGRFIATLSNFWIHVQSLAELASSATDKQAFLDSLAMDFPGLTPTARRDLRQQLQALLATLPVITTLVRGPDAAGSTESVAKAKAAKPRIVPYMT